MWSRVRVPSNKYKQTRCDHDKPPLPNSRPCRRPRRLRNLPHLQSQTCSPRHYNPSTRTLIPHHIIYAHQREPILTRQRASQGGPRGRSGWEGSNRTQGRRRYVVGYCTLRRGGGITAWLVVRKVERACCWILRDR